MNTAKVFKSGNSQAIRLPKEYQFETNEVYINRIGSNLVLFPKENPWSPLLNSLDEFSDDFMEERKQTELEERDEL